MKRISHILLLLSVPMMMWAQEATDSILSGNILKGTCLSVAATGNEAILMKNGTDGLCFYPVTDKTTLKPNTAFILSEVLQRIELSSLDNPVAGIVPVKETPQREGVLYDIQGRVVATPLTEGIYVKDGKKLWIGRKR